MKLFAQNKIFTAAIVVALILTAGINVLVSNDHIRDSIRTFLIPDHRKILARTEADFTGAGDRATIIKVKSLDTLAIEIYFFDQPGKVASEIKRIVLNETRDGYFDFQGNASNLAITDVDRDGILEIIAPTFDDNLIPRLNVYRFRKEDRSFDRLGPDNLPLSF